MTPNTRGPMADETDARHAEYWRRNIRYVGILLAVWFSVSFGFGILLVEPLNAITLPGTAYPMGFWFAQQGSIYAFVVLICRSSGLCSTWLTDDSSELRLS